MIRQRSLVATLAVLAGLAPSVFAQTQTEEEFDRCIEAIKTSNIDGNHMMNMDPEYVLFLKELSGDEFTLTSYDNLPEAMQMNFEIYEYDEVIDIRGVTKGANATIRQKRVTETLCETTYLAINAVPEDDPSRSFNNFNASNFTVVESGASSNSTFENTTDPDQMEPESVDILNTSSTFVTAAVDATSRGNITAVSTSNTTAPATSAPVFHNSAAPVAPPNGTAPAITDTAAPITNATGGTPPLIDNSTVASQPPATTASPSGSVNATSPPVVSSNETAPPATEEPSEAAVVNSTNSDSPDTTSNNTEIPATATNLPTLAPVAAPVASTEVPTVQKSNVTSTSFTMPTLPQLPPPSAAPTTEDPFSSCKQVMTYSDINEDGAMNKMEYVWFLNDNWDSPYPGGAFQDLPQALQDNFFKFASNNMVNISAVASPEYTASEREHLLDAICIETEQALFQSPASENAGEEANMATFKECLESAVQFDANTDAFLDEAEYVALISALSSGKLGKDTLESLPEVLLHNFQSLSGSETAAINLGGAQAGEMLESSQQEILAAVCVDTSYAVHEAFKDQGEVDIFDAVDTDTMLEYAACFMQLPDYDHDQDSSLDEEEYVDLVNQLAKNRYQGLNFTRLPLLLKDNFFNLETNGTINIEGSREEQTPDNDQKHFLGRVCIETTAAVNMELEFESSGDNPIGVDMGTPLVIHSSFNIYSDVMIPDHEFLMGATRELLQEAYKQFVMEVVDGLSQDGSATRRSLQEDAEFLALLDRESPTVSQIIDLNCAGASQDSMCKTVFAQYEMTPIESMDRRALYDEYVRVTQAFIDSGLLQIIMERLDPETLIAVIGASEPVTYEEAMEALADASMDLGGVPFYNDDGYDEEMASNKKKTIALVAVAVSCVLLASLAGLVAVRLRKLRLKEEAEASGEESGLVDRSMEKASDTASKDEFQQEGSSQASRGSGVFHSAGNSNADSDEEIGKMSVIDLCGRINADKHMQNLVEPENAEDSFPPLRKKENGEIASANSGDLSFAFRRYAIDGAEKDSGRSEI